MNDFTKHAVFDMQLDFTERVLLLKNSDVIQENEMFLIVVSDKIISIVISITQLQLSILSVSYIVI